MKKVSTMAIEGIQIFKDNQLTIGLDLGDRTSRYCILNEAGEIILEQELPTTLKGIEQVFSKIPRSRIALETGTHSPWVGRQLTELGHEVIVAHARNVRLISESSRKDDRLDARTLARLARIDPGLLNPVRHRSVKAQIHLTVIRARAALVSARTALVNAARGLTKSYGARLPKCGTEQMNREITKNLKPELREALNPLLVEIESLNARIAEYDRRIEQIATEVYPEVARLKQVKGVGPLIALTYVLTLDNPYRFRRSRDAGCFVGLRPGRRNSGMSEPQLHISKEGDRYLRTLLVQGAHYILGPFGQDSDLRRWGAEAVGARRKECQETSGGRGGTEASRTASQVVGQQRGLRTTAEQPKADDPSRIESPRTWIGTTELNRRDQVTAPNSWPSSRRETGAKVDYQVAAPTVSRTPTLQRATNAHQRLRMEGWRQRRLSE